MNAMIQWNGYKPNLNLNSQVIQTKGTCLSQTWNVTELNWNL